jgi:hypothetical protein
LNSSVGLFLFLVIRTSETLSRHWLSIKSGQVQADDGDIRFRDPR